METIISRYCSHGSHGSAWSVLLSAGDCSLNSLIGHGVNCLVPVPNTLDRDVNMICLLQLDQCVNVDMN